MENPEKLATRRRQTKQKHNTINVGHHYAHTNSTYIRHEPPHKQPDTKMNRTSLLCGNCDGHHNTELRTKRLIIGQINCNIEYEI